MNDTNDFELQPDEPTAVERLWTIGMWALGAIVLALLAVALFLPKAHAEGIAGKGKVADTEYTSTAARWSGPWVGATLGYSMQATDIATGAGDLSLATHDVTYGVAAGWDHQFAGTNMLIGIGGNFDFSRADSVVASWDRQWSLYGRGGFLLTPSVLAYGLVGYTQLDGSFQVPQFADKRGLTLGAGMEALFKDGWFARAEGRWVDLGGDSMPGVGIDTNQYAAMVTIGYRFGK